jgi:hypothetical protein
MKSNEKKMATNNSDGNFDKEKFFNKEKNKLNSNENITNLNKSTFISYSNDNNNNNNYNNNNKNLRKFSDHSSLRRSNEKRSTSINKIKQNEKIKEGEKLKSFEIDKLIKIEFIQSFSVTFGFILSY